MNVRTLLFILVVSLLGARALDAQTDRDNALLVLAKDDNTLLVANPASLKVTAKFPVGPDPHEVIASSDGTTAYVSNYGDAYNTLTVVDLSAKKVLPVIDLGGLRGAHGLAFVGGRVWFTAEGAKAIGSYDLTTKRVDWIMGTGQNRTHMIYVSPELNKIVTTNVDSANVSIMEKTGGAAGTGPLTGEWNETGVPVGRGAEGFDVSPDGKEIWVKVEHVMGNDHECWDVHTDKNRWWVITEPTNLYSQDLMPSLDYTLSFHIGVTMRMMAASRGAPTKAHKARFTAMWRRWEQAADALDAAEEAEDFQAVGMRCRETLIQMVRALAKPSMVPNGEAAPKRSDVVNWSSLIANTVAGGQHNDAIRGHLKAIAKSTWDLANWLTHAGGAKRIDAIFVIDAKRGRRDPVRLRCGQQLRGNANRLRRRTRQASKPRRRVTRRVASELRQHHFPPLYASRLFG